jgi:hypothetical protein
MLDYLEEEAQQESEPQEPTTSGQWNPDNQKNFVEET